jgi:hypothetical protein
MKLTRFELELRHKIYLGGYETIDPCVRVSADLTEEDAKDMEGVRKAVFKEVSELWTREVLDELRLVHKRRAGQELSSSDKLPTVMNAFKEMAKNT